MIGLLWEWPLVHDAARVIVRLLRTLELLWQFMSTFEKVGRVTPCAPAW